MEKTDPSGHETPSCYDELLSDVSRQILQSRYRAARLVNRELLLLYYAVGKRFSEKIAAEKWGAKVLEQLSDDLQKQLPGLRGFSRRSMMKMTQFADVYSENPAIGIVLCSAKNDKTVDYSFQSLHNPMGVATYQLSSDLPEHLRNVLPDPEALKTLLD